MVMNYNADLSAVALMIVYTLPRFLEFTIPMSVMISILLTFMRMSGENEIVAIKGAGISLYRLLPPVLAFCLLGFFLCLWITVFGVSWGKLSIKEKSVELARSSMNLVLQERQFNNEIEDVMIYVSHADLKTRQLKDIFIEDRRTKGVASIYISPQGELIEFEDQDVVTIRLYNGIINQVNLDDNFVSTIEFGSYNINMDFTQMNQENGKIKKDLDEISFFELVKLSRSTSLDGKQMNEILLELHEKLSIPFACIALGLLAFPLGIQSVSLRRSSGFGFGVFFFLLYYLLLAFGWSTGESGKYHPIVGMWMPNILMGGLGVFFLVRNARENPVKAPEMAVQAIKSIKQFLLKKG